VVALAVVTERAMIFKFASIRRLCAIRQNSATFRSHATDYRSQPIPSAKVLDRQPALRPHAHWHVNPATGRIECRWCVEDDLSGDTYWRQFGLIPAIYQMNRVAI
jgi:hypothetical protein